MSDENAPVDVPDDDETNAAAAKIQAVQRGNKEREELKEQEEAAAKIQAVQRGNKERAELKEQEEAAAKIQALFEVRRESKAAQRAREEGDG